MRNLKTYTLKPFSYLMVGKDRIRKFGLFHIIALEKAAIPEFAGILATIKLHYEAMFGSLLSRDQMESDRQSATIQLNMKAEEFKTKAIEIEPLVAFKLKKSGAYEEFYPHGTTEIHKMTQANALILMNRFEKKCTQYVATLDVQYPLIFKDIRIAYENAYDTQKGLQGSVKLNIPEFEAKKAEFFDQMYCNILTIAAHYYKTPEMMLAFFDENILDVRSHKTQENGAKPLSEQIAPLATKTPTITYTTTDTILLSNISDDASVFWYGGNTPNEAPTTTPTELLPGEEIEIPAATIGKYLILLNKDTVNTAKVEIMLV
jgi:hypothetical protein